MFYYYEQITTERETFISLNGQETESNSEFDIGDILNSFESIVSNSIVYKVYLDLALYFARCYLFILHVHIFGACACARSKFVSPGGGVRGWCACVRSFVHLLVFAVRAIEFQPGAHENAATFSRSSNG